MKTMVVVGCGIVGLAAAVRLQAEGLRVRIVAARVPPDTTSNRAGAIWEPYSVGPPERVLPWAYRTYAHYCTEYDDPAAGVAPVELLQVSRGPVEIPAWALPSYGIRRLAAHEIPDGFDSGFAVTVPFIHTDRYLDHLLHRFRTAGGELEIRTLHTLSEAASGAAAVINCSGLGARELAGDDAMYAIRGQLAVIARDAVPGHRCIVDITGEADPAYVFPRGDECLLGGTAEQGNENTVADHDTSARILERCARLVPALRGRAITRSVVGLRPGRREVRLCRDDTACDAIVVHNYGHGGAGFTLAWGCADEVARLVGDAL